MIRFGVLLILAAEASALQTPSYPGPGRFSMKPEAKVPFSAACLSDILTAEGVPADLEAAVMAKCFPGKIGNQSRNFDRKEVLELVRDLPVREEQILGERTRVQPETRKYSAQELSALAARLYKADGNDGEENFRVSSAAVIPAAESWELLYPSSGMSGGNWQLRSIGREADASTVVALNRPSAPVRQGKSFRSGSIVTLVVNRDPFVMEITGRLVSPAREGEVARIRVERRILLGRLAVDGRAIWVPGEGR